MWAAVCGKVLLCLCQEDWPVINCLPEGGAPEETAWAWAGGVPRDSGLGSQLCPDRWGLFTAADTQSTEPHLPGTDFAFE